MSARGGGREAMGGEPIDAKLKHLEFIQAVIARMAQNSFVFKGWAITIATGLAAFAAATSKGGALVVAVVTTLVFWGLDAYYLWLEQRFRDLYGSVAAKAPSAIDFSMAIDKSDPAATWFKACRRRHLVLFYGVIAVIEFIGIWIVKAGN